MKYLFRTGNTWTTGYPFDKGPDPDCKYAPMKHQTTNQRPDPESAVRHRNAYDIADQHGT
jgi:hypothetical protein